MTDNDMQPLARLIKDKAAQRAPELLRIRRHIHSHPELSFEEFETAKFVRSELEKAGIAPVSIGNTGWVALIKGKKGDGPVLALRADLDALPIKELTGKEYASKYEGIMHACGHDVHTTCLIGAAGILAELADDFAGTIKLIFQPGEEKLPGGASILIKEGVLKDPEPRAIVGQHVMPELEAGKAGFRPGMYMASTDEIYITVQGKGGHGAMPHQLVDPVLITAHMIVAMQQLVSRWTHPALPCVLSIGRVEANGVTNVIPDKVYLEGTFRTFDEKWRLEAHTRLKALCEGLAASMGGQAEVDIQHGYPFLKNDVPLTERMKDFAVEYMGKENVIDLELRTTAEDFAWYTQEVPGCFYRLGTGNKEKGISASVHSPYFDIDESALETGAGLMAYLAIRELGA